MKYVLSGSLGNISKPLAQQLIAAGNQVTIISSSNDKEQAIIDLGAKAAIGNVADAGFLTDVFKGADAVFVLIPPIWQTINWKQDIHNVGKSFAEAIAASGVKKVVNLSSMGAHLPDGVGPVTGIHYAEEELNKLAGVDIKHLRPGFFYNNFFANIGMIKDGGIYGNNYGANNKIVMTHPDDIAEVAAEELLNLNFTGQSVRYIASDERTSEDIAAVLGAAAGKPNLPYVEFNDEQTHGGLLGAGLSEQHASNYTEMGRAARTGKMFEDYRKHKIELSKTKLEDFGKVFAKVYAAS